MTFTPAGDQARIDARRRARSQSRSQIRSRESISRSDCLALLASGGHGRVAATMRAVPVILPVRFALLGDDLAFSPGHGDDLAKAVTNSVIAFETDHVDAQGFPQWGVHVTGVARAFTGSTEGAPTDDTENFRFHLSSEIIGGWRAVDY
jgi:hypothetical protein